MNEWLDVIPDKKNVVPQKLDDFQAILDNSSVILVNLTPSLGEVSTDDYYLTDERWMAHSVIWEKNAYAWESQIFVDNNGSTNWSAMYQIIYYSNLVLEGLSALNDNSLRFREIKGSALLYRALAYYQLSQIFCDIYNEKDDTEKLGLPLKLNTNLEERLRRSSLKETYGQIIKDLEESIPLLPQIVPIKTRPNLAAALILLSKTYLVTGNYEKSLEFAEKALQQKHTLINYNSLDNPIANYPFKTYHDEVVLQGGMITANLLSHSRMRVSQDLYDLYDEDDIRKIAYFSIDTDGIRFKGSYYGGSTNFGGISWNEVYLIKAECQARLNLLVNACETLNNLLENRIKSSMFTRFNSENQINVIAKIIEERRKELLFRGIRWSDIKRLNKFHNSGIYLKRKILDSYVTLQPNDKKFVLPIPDNVIELGGYQQNER